MRNKRQAGLLTALALTVCLLAAGSAAAQGSQRVVRGQVLDDKGETVAQAIVHLKNKSSGETVTMVTSSEGRYQFNDVDTKSDFRIRAELKGRKSRERSISQFDTRPIVVVNLTLEAAEEEAEKEEEKKEEKE